MQPRCTCKFGYLVVLPMTLALAAITPVRAASFDWSTWDDILKQRVGPAIIDGVRLSAFDYVGLSKSRAAFDGLVLRLKAYAPADLKTRDERLAFWINAYNLAAVKMVLDYSGISSLNDIGPRKGAVWKMEAVVIGNKAYSLDAIENEILRKMDEPRIHFAIVCASVSCPDIRAQAYIAEKLDKQLDDQTRRFLANGKKGMRVDGKRKKLVLTKLFEWFAGDFGGKQGIRKFIANHLPPGQKAATGWKGFDFVYFDYNWKLNRL